MLGSKEVWSPATPHIVLTGANSQADQLLMSAAASGGGASAGRACPPAQSARLYALAACASWNDAATCGIGASPQHSRWQGAVVGFADTVQAAGCWRGGASFEIPTSEGTLPVEVRCHGFPWAVGEFDVLHPVGCYRSASLTRHHVRDGLGVPVVVERRTRETGRPGEGNLRETSYFAATMVVRPASDVGVPTAVVVKLFNPHACDHVATVAGAAPLAADFSAPHALRQSRGESGFNPLQLFMHPDANHQAEGLRFLEPYQPGKIHVVLVHGLVSSPGTWIDLVNDLQARREFTDRFQIWAFGYATGRPFVRAAADLRRQLARARAELQGCGPDPALENLVLIGHSMGGLVSKLQVTWGGDPLWEAISDMPLEQFELNESERARARDMVYFQPSPAIRRVIFVGTPHRGAAAASQLVGRLSSTLVHRDAGDSASLVRAIERNQSLLSRIGGSRIPTSIDMLEPSNPMLRAIDRLPLADWVHLHTVAGEWNFTLGPGRGDGVVPLSSAVHPQAESELVLNASHTAVHRRLETADEVERILELHVAEAAQLGWAPPTSPRDRVVPSPGGDSSHVPPPVPAEGDLPGNLPID
ncbi:MAG: esterase/lipase family protein [Planctomycetaceae bacterium]